jgi:hypothetical protein
MGCLVIAFARFTSHTTKLSLHERRQFISQVSTSQSQQRVAISQAIGRRTRRRTTTTISRGEEGATWIKHGATQGQEGIENALGVIEQSNASGSYCSLRSFQHRTRRLPYLGHHCRQYLLHRGHHKKGSEGVVQGGHKGGGLLNILV